jgi:hypothetical protein
LGGGDAELVEHAVGVAVCERGLSRVVGGGSADQQVRVGGARPQALAFGQPLGYESMGELVQAHDVPCAVAAVDGQAPASHIEVGQAQVADLGPGHGVDRDQGDDQSGAAGGSSQPRAVRRSHRPN